MILIDTSAWVEFLRRRGDPAVKQAVARLIEADTAAYTCPIAFELWSGVRSGEEDDLEEALGFSRHLPFEVGDWRQAAGLERRLRLAGQTVPRDDVFVATVAIRAGIELACRDRHFDAIRQVVGEDLQLRQL